MRESRQKRHFSARARPLRTRRRHRFRAARFQKAIRHADLPRATSRRERTRGSSAAGSPAEGDPNFPIAPARPTRAAKETSSQCAGGRRDESSRRLPPAASAQPPASDRCRASVIAKAAARKSQRPTRRTAKPLRSVRKPGAESRALCHTATPRRTTADLAWWRKTGRCAEASASPESARRFGCAIQYPRPPAADSTKARPTATRKEK